MLHVTNGDSAGGSLRQAGLAGDVVEWRDALQGGLVADRLTHQLVLLGSDAGRAFVVGGMAVPGWTNSLMLWHLVAAVAGSGTKST